MIQFDNFNFNYSSKKQVYKDVTLDMEEGKIYGLFGKNGIGKTTLLKAMVGLSYPSSGRVKVGDFIPKDRKPDFLSSVFYIQDTFDVPKLTVKKYKDAYSMYYAHFSESQFYEYLSLFKVGENEKLQKLSFGQQKKFLIAFGLACNTPYLFMDEPTNGLDIPSKIAFRKLLISVMDERKTIVISTHQAKDLEFLIDHVLVVDDLEIVLNASTYEISEKLAFRHYQQKPTHLNVLNTQPVINGYLVLEENLENEETEIVMEQLMVAAIEHPQKIKNIFKN